MFQLLTAQLLAAFALAAAPAARLPPVDQCASDPSFVQFRNDLLGAIARRDADYLLSVVSDDIKISFGSDHGRAAMIELWGLDRPEGSELWETLAATLALGCAAHDDGTYVSPSFFIQVDAGDDPFDTYLAVVPGAPLLAEPWKGADLLARLDWHVLTWLSEQDGWYEMRLADGRRGFVEAAHARSLVDYRAWFQRMDGRWRMTLFIAGD